MTHVTTTTPGRAARPDPKDPVTSSAATPPPAPPDGDGARAPRRLGPALWALALVLLVVAGLLAWKVAWPAHRLEQERASDAAAVAAGRAMATNLSSLDYQNLDPYLTQVTDGATGDFKSSYTKNLGVLRQVLTANKSTSRPTRVEVALVSADADSAEVLAGVVTSVTNTSVPDGETKTYRFDMKLVKVAGQWKVSTLDTVS